MLRNRRRLTALAVTVALVTMTAACAAKGVRNRTRVAALSLADTIAALDQAEMQLYASGAYGAVEHDKVSLAIARTARAAQAYTVAVAGWPEHVESVPVAVTTATASLRLSLDTLASSFPAAERVREVLIRALLAIRQVLDAAQSADLRAHDGPPVSGAQLPAMPPQIMALLSIYGMAYRLVQALKERLKAEGATDEQLAAAVATLDGIANRREAELGAGGSEPSA